MSKKKEKSLLAEEKEVFESEKLSVSNKKKEPQIIADNEAQRKDLIEELKESVKGLWYMSETDAEINVAVGKESDSVTQETLIEQFNVSPEKKITEKSSADFFQNLTEMQDWYGEEEKETAEKFSTVEKLLEENLKDLKVFKVGEVEVDIYVIGLDSQSILMGITTKAVET